MIPVKFPESNAILAFDQDDYEPLPVFLSPDPTRRVVFCCRLSDAEIADICATRTLWLQQLTFGRNFQPIALSTQRPHDLPTVET
jgi:hypothetical protein